MALMQKFRNKKFWKSGTMDVLSFIVMGPAIIVIFAALLNIIQLGEFKEQLEYATYAAGRAAVCSPSLQDAQNNAEQIAKENLATKATSINGGLDGVTVQISAVDYDKEKIATKAKYKKWEKGNYIMCTVTADYLSVGSVYGSEDRSCSMVMAIEYDE